MVLVIRWGDLKSRDLKSTQNWIQFFSNKKFRNCVYFFTCILPNYMANIIFKDLKKNNLFENMTAGFLMTCQKSLRREISLICHWNIDSLKQKLSFVYSMVPRNDQNIIQIQYRLHCKPKPCTAYSFSL